MGSLFSFPKKIQIQTINLCNYTCQMCPYPAVSNNKGVRLESSLFTRIIEDVRSAGRRVDLCLMLQNEPLLDKRFINFLAEAHHASDAITEISTVTNGSTLNADSLTLLMEYPRFGMTISINATERDHYERIHGVDLLDRIVSLLKHWHGPRERIRLSYIVETSSLQDARAFQQLWADTGYRLRLVPILSRAGAVGITRDRRIIYDAGYSYCHYPTDTLNIIADGRVILCCQDWQHATTYGDLNESSISEIWNSSALKKVRDAAIAGRIREEVSICANCDYPMRSSVRFALEAFSSAAPQPCGNFPIVEHEALLQVNGSTEPVRVLVCDVNPEDGFVDALISATDSKLDELRSCTRGAFRLNGFGGKTFSFGAMTPVWCPITSIKLQPIPSSEMIVLRLYLEEAAEEFQLLRWYRAEWEHMKQAVQTEYAVSD